MQFISLVEIDVRNEYENSPIIHLLSNIILSTNMEGWIVLGLILIVIAYLFGRIGFAVEEDKERSEYAKTNETIDKAINAEDNKTRKLVVNQKLMIRIESVLNTKVRSFL